jgi:hypothetical protein
MLLYTSLDAGIKEWDYWNMTYGEIINAIQSYNRVYERQQKEKAVFLYKTADLIAAGIGTLFDENATFPQIYEAFPSLFQKEKALMQKAEVDKAIELYKANFVAFAENHNSRWGGNNDT